jgi:hypothetical protein
MAEDIKTNTSKKDAERRNDPPSEPRERPTSPPKRRG